MSDARVDEDRNDVTGLVERQLIWLRDGNGDYTGQGEEVLYDDSGVEVSRQTVDLATVQQATEARRQVKAAADRVKSSGDGLEARADTYDGITVTAGNALAVTDAIKTDFAKLLRAFDKLIEHYRSNVIERTPDSR